MVAQRDFEFHLPHVRIDTLVVDLLAFADDIERVANVDAERLVFRRVVNVVFTNEQNTALGIFLIYAYVSGGHRHSKSGFFLVFEFVVHHHIVFEGRSGILLVVIIEILAIDDETLLHGNSAALQQADLLCFFVFDGSLAAQTVEVIFAEVFLCELFGACRFCHGHIACRHWSRSWLNAIQIASNKLQPRIVKRRTAVVRKRHPAIQIGGFIVTPHRQNVV